jgi:hypothetical protein
MLRPYLVSVFVLGIATGLAACSSDDSAAESPNDHDSGELGDAGDFESCSAPGDCVIAANDCCGGFPVPTSYSAIRRDRAQAWRQRVCPTTNYTCDASLIINDKLLAFCVEGKCKEIVIPEDSISACSTNDDCTTVSSSCAQRWCGDPTPPFVVRADSVATLVQQTCPGAQVQSVQCPPGDADASIREAAVCGANGHCQ